MRFGHLLSRIAVCTATVCLLSASAYAGFGFGFGGDDAGKSGLDLNRGYDINTVATVTGRVASPPKSGEVGVTVAIVSGGETVNLYVGPGSYWGKNGIPVHLNDDITAKGSKSQGKDGKNYLLTQKLVNRTTGAQVELRNEKGEAGWLSAEGHSTSTRDSRGGSMMRSGGGGMMRSGGGGGMMRR